MTKNMGGIDRILRAVIGIVLLYVGFLQMAGLWGTLLGIVGAVLLVTAAIGWCPAYMPFGLSTRGKAS